LSKETHRELIYIIGYIAWRYRKAPEGADLEGAVFNVTREVYEDVKRLLRRKGLDKFLEVSYEE